MDPREHERFVREKLNARGLEDDLKAAVSEAEIRFDAGSRALYTTDASNYRQVPIGVVLPKTAAAVVKTLEICHRHGAPVVSRGGGTGLCGQSCNIAVVIDHSKYLNRVLEIDPQRRIARVEPGCILDHLREETEKHHLTYGPDPATHDHNTFGGMIGNNSCGIHSIMSGRTVDNILELEVVTYDGVRLRVGKTPAAELAAILSEGGRRGEIYGRLRDLRDRYADLIRSRYPKIPRRVSGYNLDELLPEKGFNVAGALVGTEGTCVTILQATVQLVHSPPHRALLVLGYPDVFAAGDHVVQVRAMGPVGLEGLDDTLIDFMRIKGMHPKDVQLLPAGNGWLLAEFGGETDEEAREKARRAMALLDKEKNPPSMKLFADRKEEEHIWAVRESGLGATANVPGHPLSWPGWEDAAVDPARLGDYLREFRTLLATHGYEASLYGHFGDGCIHCRISFDLFSRGGIVNWMRFLDAASDLVVKYGGSFSAEHGDGQSKAIYLPKMYGPELMQAFREFKEIWDPQWKMNPGKVIDPYRPDENLRLGTDYHPWQPETHFRYPHDNGSYDRAILRCVGVGKCRRTHKAFMCPSFLATREEKHTTRGRSRILFEMLRGEVIADGWKSVAVREALELCLACKGCKSDCPINVDMATWKAEFLSQHYQWRLRPRPAYAMGLIGIWGALGRKLPRLANFATQAPFIGAIAKWIGGIAPQRAMPRFAPASFTAAYRPVNGEGEKVLLYPDLFNDCFYPDALHAAADVLARWGFRVLIPDQPPPAVRPPIDYGMLAYAKRRLLEAVSLLAPYARAGVPVIFLEPSTAAVFRDELPEMFPAHPDGVRVAQLTFLLCEFIAQRQLPLPQLAGKAVFHGHCHQKAVLNVDAARQVLETMGLEYVEPQPGCCGMAGSFGFESGKYDISMKIAEQKLLPAVRNAGAASWIVADGFSCRQQILHGTGREALHLAQLLRAAFQLGNGMREWRQASGGKARSGESVLETRTS